MNTIGSVFLESAIKRVVYYKQLSERVFEQLEEKDFHLYWKDHQGHGMEKPLY